MPISPKQRSKEERFGSFITDPRDRLDSRALRRKDERENRHWHEHRAAEDKRLRALEEEQIQIAQEAFKREQELQRLKDLERRIEMAEQEQERVLAMAELREL